MLSFGCSGKPSRVHAPSIDASAAGAAAMEQYDTNKDGKVAGAELQSAPSLREALGNLDKDGDKAVSAEEVTGRILAWQESKTGLTPVTCAITFRGQPLAGAKVVFEPEKFLGENIKACEGTTNQRGMASLSIPNSERKLPGGAPGLYLIRITSTNAQIPAHYNTQTTLGAEVANDSATAERGVMLNLQ
ncbi:MAG: hypothetical protein U9N87_12365 [Planctomycetota bacterium]|nr:hypothetical protein [Planctomycetota bacterium]